MMRTAEQYFENLKEQREEIGQVTSSFRQFKYFKYGGLAASIISLYAVDLLIEEFAEKISNWAKL
ncbi:MAG: hypothetical protein HWD61_01635 [Parachlamydiaceae bacterium]|nr:MAG: hypothetical protein HWD61_01635 [Parachlamydiaceae bacterium]